jgi:hypothetical protein
MNWCITLGYASRPCSESLTSCFISQILKGYEGVQEGVAPGEEYEYSEMMLYKAMVLEEGGRFSEALSVLNNSQEDLRDQLGYQEAKARLLFKLGRTGEAEKCYRYPPSPLLPLIEVFQPNVAFSLASGVRFGCHLHAAVLIALPPLSD